MPEHLVRKTGMGELPIPVCKRLRYADRPLYSRLHKIDDFRDIRSR